MAGASATLKDLSVVGIVVPPQNLHFPPFYLLGTYKNQMESGIWEWNWRSEALTLPDLLYLQEQIKLSTGVWCLAINLTNELFSSLKWEIRKNLLFPGMNNDKHLQSWPRTVSTLLLCDITKVRRIWKSWTSWRTCNWLTRLIPSC